MLYSLRYFDDAREDVRKAKVWYKEQKPGLEKRFSEAIKTAILKLHKYPLAYSVRYKNIRIIHPKTFPYGIHYYLEDTTSQIVIIAIVHNKRHPDTFQKRV